MSDSLDRQEMIRCLKEANIYEDNMSEYLITNYYRAIKNSESSLKEELERSEDDDTDKSVSNLPKTISKSVEVRPSSKGDFTKNNEDLDEEDSFNDKAPVSSEKIVEKPPVESETNNNSTELIINDKTTILEMEVDDDVPIGFNDMPETNIKCSLPITSHPLVYVNIQNSPLFIASTTEDRRKMLYDYHMALAKREGLRARLSQKLAPIKPPIRPTRYDTLKLNNISPVLVEDDPPPDTYISRSGRLTKRKVYVENDDSNEETFIRSKKTRVDGDWASVESPKSKANRTWTKKSELPTEEAVHRASTPDKFDELKGLSSTPVSRPRTYHRKLTNEEVMSRSSLFSDTPTGKRSRGHQLVLAGKAEAEKQKKREEDMEKFANSIVVDPEDLEDDRDENNVVHDVDKAFERRRVTPPRPTARKSIHSRKKMTPSIIPLNITTSKDNNRDIPSDATKKTPPDQPSTSTSTSTTPRLTKQQMNMVQCPLCTVFFHQKKIEEHASTCGEESFNHGNQEKVSKISCEICDTIIPLTTSYEVHVKECISKQNGI